MLLSYSSSTTKKSKENGKKSKNDTANIDEEKINYLTKVSALLDLCQNSFHCIIIVNSLLPTLFRKL